MATQPLESRLSAVEQALIELAQSQAPTEAQFERTQAQFERTQAQFEAQRQRTEAQIERTEAQFEAQSQRILAQIDEYRAESRASGARLDRQWGELANKMGTLTEDIILPGIPTVFRTFFGEEGRVDLAVRV
jgi:hypothetical protein